MLALAASDAAPILTNAWYTKKTIMAGAMIIQTYPNNFFIVFIVQYFSINNNLIHHIFIQLIGQINGANH